MSNKKISYLIAICSVSFLTIYYIILNAQGFILGSTFNGDYWGQHVPILELVRSNYFNNNTLFPELIQVGNLQNFAYTFYYGTLNPLTFVSLLFPVIDTVHWMQVQQIIIISISLVLMNLFLIRFESNKFRRLTISLLTTITIASIQNFANSIMFIYPLPIILSALIALQYKRRYLLISSVALVFYINFMTAHIMLLILLIYYFVFEYEGIKKFFTNFCLNYLLGALIGMPIILTQLYIILTGSRSEGVGYGSGIFNENIMNLLTSSNLDFGMPIIGLFCLLSVPFLRKKKMIVLGCILILLFILDPLNYLLNAGDYVMYRQSILYVPFFAVILTQLTRLKYSFYLLIISFTYTIYYVISKKEASIFSIKFENDMIIYLLFLLFIFIILATLLMDKSKVSAVLSIWYIMGLFIISNSTISSSEPFVLKNVKQCNGKTESINSSVFSSQYGYRTTLPNYIEYSCDINPSIYLSLSNNYLKDLYLNKFSLPEYGANTRNVYTPDKIHNKIMGITNIQEGEGLVGNINDPFIYTNTNVINDHELERASKLDFSYELLHNDFSSAGNGNKKTPGLDIRKIDLENEYNIKESFSKNIDYNMGDGVLAINIKMNSNNCDFNQIKIENITNVKSRCDYMYFNNNYDMTYWIDSEYLKDGLDVNISKGKYSVDYIEYAFVSDEEIYNSKENIKPINDLRVTSDDTFEFKTNLEEPGYVITSIPFDQGFKIKSNGTRIEPEIVNDGFLGFKVEESEQLIVIDYDIKYYRIGIIIAIATIMVLVIHNRFKIKK